MPDTPNKSPSQPAAPAMARAPLLVPPLAAILELALFAAVILALEWLVPSFDLGRIEPHPAWLAVLLLSVQYGTLSGLLAAAVCIALSIHSGFPEQEVGENLFVYLLRAWAQPMLWLAAAVLLGQFRTRHILERAELTQELSTVTSQRAAIAAYASNVRRRCDLLERHVAGREGTEPVAVLALLSKLGSGAATDLVASFTTCMNAVLPGARATLLRVHGSAIDVVATTGTAPTRGSDMLDPASPLLRDLASRRQPVSVMTEEGEQLLDGAALVAVPIEAGGQLLGILLVHDADADALTAALPEALTVVAAALAPAFAAMPEDDATDGNIVLGSASSARTDQGWLKRLWRPWQTTRPASDKAASRNGPAARRMVR